MNQIDLVSFAEHSQKLPGKLLSPVAVKKSHAARILSGHLIDFWMAATATALMGAICSQAFGSLMVTRSLERAYSPEAVSAFAFFCLPFVLLNYFFFSYFMNHGQTWGMFLMKRRISMPEQSFQEAFKWAAHSLLVCMSGGLYYSFRKEIWKDYQASDYLYSQLLAHKEDMSIDLLTRIDEQPEHQEEIQWQRAA